MKCLLAVLLSLLGIVPPNATGTKRPFRDELAEQLRSSGYSLADVYGGDAFVVSVDSRTAKKTKLKDPEKVASVECSSPEGRYFVFHKNGGIWIRDTKSNEIEQIEAEGQYSTECFSPEGKFVYSTGKIVRIYDLAKRKSADVKEGGSFPTWSPDGKWLGFDDGKHYVLRNQTTGSRKKLFSTKDSAGPDWSPDSRYLSYTKSGGSTGGFLFWGIKCIEPYRYGFGAWMMMSTTGFNAGTVPSFRVWASVPDVTINNRMVLAHRLQRSHRPPDFFMLQV